MKANCTRLLIAMATFILGCFINTISASENMLVINAASEKPLVQKVTYKPDNVGLSVRYVINSLRISDNSLIIEGLSVCDFKENNCCQREDIIFVPDDMDAIVTFRPASMKTIDVASKKLVVNFETKTLNAENPELSNCTYSEFHYRGHKFLRINICPVVKNAESKMSIFDDLTYDVTFTTQKESKGNEWLKPIDIESDALIAMTLNKETVQNLASLPKALVGEPVRDVLFVTSNKLLNAVSQYADFRRLFGFNIAIASDDDWDCDKIDQYIKSWYKSSEYPYAVLLIGNHEKLPSTYSDYAPEAPVANATGTFCAHITDIPYACMNDTKKELIPDVTIGRIPIDLTTARGVFEKITSYETNPSNSSTYYNSAVVAGDFFPYTDGKRANTIREAFSQGIGSCERIFNKLTNIGIDCKYIYQTEKATTKPVFHYNLDSLRAEIQYSSYNWNREKTYDLLSSLQQENIFVQYNGHGSNDGWERPSFLGSGVKQLTQTKCLPLIVSSACRTGDFSIPGDNKSFAEQFLTKEDGGCIAIFAPTAVSLAPSNNYFGEGIVDALWPSNPIYNYITSETKATKSITKLGELFMIGLYRMDCLSSSGYNPVSNYNSQFKRYMREVLHLFGDPTMNLRIDLPRIMETPLINRTESGITVSGCPNDDTIVVTLYDKDSGSIYTFNEGNIQFKTDHSKAFAVGVTSPKYIPFFSDADPAWYIQNETITGSYVVDRCSELKIGSCVTDRQTGPVTFKDGSSVRIEVYGEIIIEPSVTIEKNSYIQLNSND